VIKLLACDLDGTVLEDDRIPEPALHALEDFCRRGGTTVIATGRSVEVIDGLLAASGVTPAHSFPHHTVSVDKLIHKRIEGEYVPLRHWNQKVLSAWQPVLETILKRLDCIEDALRTAGLSFVPLHDGAEQRRRQGFISWAFDSVASAAEAAEVLHTHLADVPAAHAGRNGSIAGVTLKWYNKGAAVDRIRSDLNLAAREVLAVGDSANDLSMLDERFGFRPATVANAEESIKAVVRARSGCVAASPLAAGVCEVIEALAR